MIDGVPLSVVTSQLGSLSMANWTGLLLSLPFVRKCLLFILEGPLISQFDIQRL